MNSITSALTESNSDRQKELLVYFQNLEQQTDGWRIAIEQLTNNRANLDESAIFFYFKIVECYVKTRFEIDSEANKFLVKEYVYNYFVSKKYDYQPFLLNKFASIVNALFLIEYPLGKWNAFFQDFLAHCNDQESTSLFLRILDQINTEIGEREHILTIKETEKANLIKDLMRESAVNLIVQFWFNIVHNYHDNAPGIVSYCLTVMSKYVDWIDVKIVTVDSRMNDILNLLYNNQIRIGVLDFLFGILHKGMDPIAKATFIEEFCQLQCINELIAKDYDKSENEFVSRLAKFLNKIGVELIESFKKLKSSKTTHDVHKLGLVFNAIENKFLTLCRFLSNDDLNISIKVHPFAREYIQLIKNLTTKQTNSNQFVITDARVQEIILVFTEILIKHCKYPIDFNFSTDQLEDDADDEFEMYRKSCNVLFENLNFLNQDFFGQFVCTNIVEATLHSENLFKLKFNELEIALYFLKSIGEWLESKDNQKFNKLMNGLITNSIIDYPHISITIMYFELICRYEKQFSSPPLNELMPQVLVSFLDSKNGVKSLSIRLRCKVSSFFNRFAKSNIKNKSNGKKFLTYSQEIISRLEPLIKLDYYLSFKGKTFNEFNANEQQVKANRDNHLLLYETVSFLIMQNNLIEDKEKLILLKRIFLDTILENANQSSALLQGMLSAPSNNDKAMIDQSIFEKQIKVICEDIAHLINLTVYILKAITNLDTTNANDGQTIFLEIFDQFVKLLTLHLDEECLNTLQQSLCHFLHRLIVCLDNSQILALLPVLIPRSYFTVATIQVIVPLINRLVTKFKQSYMFEIHLLTFLNQFFLPFVSSIFNLTNSGSLEDEDKVNLQKSYFSFIFTIANYVPEVLRNLNNQVFEQILITIVQGLEINDLSIQKFCVNILKRLVENHEQISKTENLTNGNCLLSTSESDVTLFKCVYTSAIPTAINIMVSIPDQNQIINEVLSFLVAVFEVRGANEFTQYLKTDQFAIYGTKMNQLCEALGSKDLKALKILFKEIRQTHQTLTHQQ